MSSTESAIPQGQMRIYGCGGMGINLAKAYNESPANPEAGYAVAHPVYIDTSKSNLTEDHNPTLFYCLEDMDGSGKVRKENHQAIGKNIRQILQEFKPMDFNVVIFSASGGSGSVFGPLLVSELLTRKQPLLVMMVGSDESAITTQNTMNTLKSLEAISKKVGYPIVMQYEHNDRDVKRSEVDNCFVKAVSALSVLVSRQNRELDSQDILNWVQFNRSTQIAPSLSLLKICRSNDTLEGLHDPVSVASLYASPDDDVTAIAPDYHCAGYPVTESVKSNTPVHFAIMIDGLDQITKRLTGQIEELDNHRRARVEQSSLIQDGDVVMEDGLVL